MLPLTVSVLVWFLLSVAAHITVSRLFAVAGKIRPLSFTTFLLGYVAYVWLGNLSLAGTLLFFLLSISYLVLLSGILLDDISPSSIILASLAEAGALTEAELIRRFTDTTIIGKRLTELAASGWLTGRNARYRITSKGKLLAECIRVYRKFLGADHTG